MEVSGTKGDTDFSYIETYSVAGKAKQVERPFTYVSIAEVFS